MILYIYIIIGLVGQSGYFITHLGNLVCSSIRNTANGDPKCV